MPWQCTGCGSEAQDDVLACPSCARAKTSWTISPEQTRAFVVPGASVEVLRGTEEGAWVDADHAPAIPAAQAQQLAREGRSPRIRDQFKLRVWLSSNKSETLDVQLGVGFATQELSEHAYSRPKAVDLPFLLVYGPEGPPPAGAFGDVVVVDISEESETGYAPQIEVGLGRKRPRELPVRPSAPPALRVLRIIELEDVSFHNDSAVLLPAAAPGDAAEQAPQTGLSVIRAVLNFAERFPHMSLLAAGHTDSVGSEAANLELSALRAANATAYLRGDRAGWAESAAGRHEVEDWQQILTWLAATRGWGCDPGGIDNKAGPKSRAGLDAFRTAYADAYGQPAGEGPAPSAADWGAFFDCYDEALAGLLGATREELPRRRELLRFHSAVSVGCGEAWPVDSPGLDGHASQTNRRVELLFFEESELPELRGHTPAGYDPAQCDLYGAGRYQAEHVPVDVEGYTPADHLVLRLPLWDRDGEPLPNLPVEVDADGATLAFTTDAQGVVEILLPRPAPAFIDLRWDKGGKRSQRFTIEHSDFESDEGQSQELQNLFFAGRGLRKALETHLAAATSDLFGADRYREAMREAIAMLNEEAS